MDEKKRKFNEQSRKENETNKSRLSENKRYKQSMGFTSSGRSPFNSSNPYNYNSYNNETYSNMCKGNGKNSQKCRIL